MNNKIATSIRQSARLIACGMNLETADMSWGKDIKGCGYTLLLRAYHTFPKLFRKDYLYPAWSMGCLIELLPKTIKADGITYKLNIDYPPIEQVAVRYNTEDDDLDSLFGLMGDDLLELSVLIFERLHKRGYKFNSPKHED